MDGTHFQTFTQNELFDARFDILICIDLQVPLGNGLIMPNYLALWNAFIMKNCHTK